MPAQSTGGRSQTQSNDAPSQSNPTPSTEEGSKALQPHVSLGDDNTHAAQADEQAPSVERLLHGLTVVDPSFTKNLPAPSPRATSIPTVAKESQVTSAQSTGQYQKDHTPICNVDTVASSPYKSNLCVGQTAAHGSTFAPFGAVTKYCYKFVSTDYVQPLASAFWDAGKIWNRHWDLFYLNPSVSPMTKPVILVPEQQLLELLGECKRSFPGANLAITEDLRQEGLLLTFDFEQPELRPYYLGLSDSRVRHDCLLEEIPHPNDSELAGMSTIAEQGDDRSLNRFKEMIGLAQEIAKNKKKVKREKHKAEQDVQKQRATNSLLQAQRYLGLAPPQSDDVQAPGASEGGEARPNVSHPIDISCIAPFARDKDVVLIAIDLEAWEHSSNVITEIGIATLDSRTLNGLAPGRVGEAWQQVVRGRHFRILEHKNKVNEDFVQGCPEKFEFGESEFVARDLAASACTSCFHPPFSATVMNSSSTEVSGEEIPPRNIVLVGHDVGQDIEMCKKLGFHPANRGNLLTTLDTAALYRAYCRDPNPKSLGGILSDFDIAGWNLHNAGNDAVYTLWALMAMCVSAAAEQGTDKLQQRLDVDLERRNLTAVQQAHKRVQDEVTGWETGGDSRKAGVYEVGESSEMQYAGRQGKQGKPVFGPERPPAVSSNGLYTMGGVPLDV
ncbi:hypothetical protein K431DRAFT_233035 [Polychaeton citri CBS 116435]|uniref:Gfd2/YDR514C-like C-terminal domain-containing protein n=1 Tax=Polychaeton citri CBS 116435 TaxID=1314669 RepID=A0A9P4PYT9_9PEZI|nr:hypothetical protein K431DRAFT_233035 [Polychaeton citri CBS 116435]